MMCNNIRNKARTREADNNKRSRFRRMSDKSMLTSDDMMSHAHKTDITIGTPERADWVNEMNETSAHTNFLHHLADMSSVQGSTGFPGRDRGASMPAALGNAVHNSVEDICNLDIADRDDDEVGWMPPTAKAILDRHRKIEKDGFMATPRHPRWKMNSSHRPTMA